MSDRMKDTGLAFEDGIDGSPAVLWRLLALRTRPRGDGEVRHTNWFASEERALQHADWINDGRSVPDKVAAETDRKIEESKREHEAEPWA